MDYLVSTPFGKLTGRSIQGVTRFLGVPYASAPVGALRFRLPTALAPWDGVFHANEYRKDPMQPNAVLGPDYYSEDCLYLNIWIPDGMAQRSDPLPVMVWIPGGAYETGGSGADTPDGPPLYDCTSMAMDTGCIIVSVSYRLNVFGFLNLSQYSDCFEDNLGMKDIIAALRWIQQTISFFGGDAGRVTIFGQSAGAGAVSALLLIDEAKDLFHRAIIQSNCFETFYSPEESNNMTLKFLEFLGLDVTRANGLLEKSYQELMAACHKLDEYALEHYFGRCAFGPVVDGTWLRDYPTLASFEQLDKVVLVGSNLNEGNFLVSTKKWGEAEVKKFFQLTFARIPSQTALHLRALYSQFPKKQALADLLTDVMYTLPKLRFAEHISRHSKIYMYRYEYATPVMMLMGLKVCHVAEMLPLFDLQVKPYSDLKKGANTTMKQIGSNMRRRWGAFAHTGNPNTPGLPYWDTYDEVNRYTLLIGKTDKQISDPDRQIREWYAGIDRILV